MTSLSMPVQLKLYQTADVVPGVMVEVPTSVDPL